MHEVNRNAVIAIAGTVGIGKSTLTEKLAERLNFKTAYEKVDGNPYLEKYYSDFAKWGFHLQTYFLAERFKTQKRIFESGGGYILDRTIYEDLEIFAKSNYENGTMSEEDFTTYMELFEAMVYTPYFKDPDLVIYIEGELDFIIERIKERGRGMEVETDIAYWKQLYARYDKWIETFNRAPLLRINLKDYDAYNEDDINMIVAKIEKVLNYN